jgi:hypothetical protein
VEAGVTKIDRRVEVVLKQSNKLEVLASVNGHQVTRQCGICDDEAENEVLLAFVHQSEA